MGLSSEVGRLLSQQFELHQMSKTYHAVVRGWLEGADRLDYPLTEELDKIADKYASPDKGPQPAVTDWQGLAITEQPVAIGRYPTARYSLIELQPATGRKHQLRRHLAHLRHPIIGDTTHGDLRQNRGAAQHFGCERLMLHASSGAEPSGHGRAAVDSRRARSVLAAHDAAVWLAAPSPRSSGVEFDPQRGQDKAPQ